MQIDLHLFLFAPLLVSIEPSVHMLAGSYAQHGPAPQCCRSGTTNRLIYLTPAIAGRVLFRLPLVQFFTCGIHVIMYSYVEGSV